LKQVLVAEGASVAVEDDGALAVQGMAEDDIGELAGRAQVVLHELSPQAASLEEAFMELTAQAVEYEGTSQLVTTNGSHERAEPPSPATKVRS
jgi:ABC-2 type transport system ATP-binding protein